MLTLTKIKKKKAFSYIQYLFLKKSNLFLSNNDSFLKRNSIFFHDFSFFLKIFSLFFSKFIFKKISYYKLFNYSFSESRLYRPFFFLSNSTDSWFSTFFNFFFIKNIGFHFIWGSSGFFFFFKKLRDTSKEFFPIFFISPSLYSDLSFLYSISLFYKFPKFVFFDFDSNGIVTLQTYLDFFSINNIFPLFFNKKNIIFYFFFWIKIIEKFF